MLAYAEVHVAIRVRARLKAARRFDVSFVRRPAEMTFCLANGCLAGGVRMRFVCALRGHSVADDRMDANDRRFVLDALGFADRAFDADQIVAIEHLLNVPARRLESLRPV